MSVFLLLLGGLVARAELKSLSEEFIAAHEKYSPLGSQPIPTRFEVRFSPMKDGVHGECRYQASRTRIPTIVLNVFDWERMTDTKKKIVVFHELGHCLLKRDHRADWVVRDGRKVPVSLMFPHAIPDEVFTQYEDLYLEELFFRQ